MPTIKEVEVKTFRHEAVCDQCSNGFYRPAGNIVLTSHPPKYPHACTACGHAVYLTDRYPLLVTRPVE